jgi:hypothetical protein
MKTILLPLLAIVLATSASLAGNWLGSGPWSDGGYYPGQFDGRYTASFYNNLGSTDIPTAVSTNTNTSAYIPGGVVSGVLGFGIRSGSPSTDQSTTSQAAGLNGANSFASSFVSDSIRLDTSHNYFVAFVDGATFAGQTVASVNIDQNSVNGNLLNGTSSAGFERVETPILNTNGFIVGFNTTFISVPGAIAGGFFNANITKNRAIFAFSGPGKITSRKVGSGTNAASSILFTYPFSLNGIKTSDDTSSGYVQTTAQ